MNEPTDYIKSELLGSTARYPFAINTSASRALMSAGQDSGKLTLCNSDPRLTPSGVEEEFAAFTFKKEIEEDCSVVEIIPLQTNSRCWQLTYITQSMDTGELDVVILPESHSMHNKFGFMYKKSDIAGKVVKGDILSKGTILADSPSVINGDYSPGINLQVAICSLPGTAEDGIVFNRSSLDKTFYDGIREITFKVYPDETCRPIYLNGNVIPEPGERVRTDNLLAAIMKIDDRNFLAQFSESNFNIIDYISDKLPQIDGGWDAEVIAVEVLRSQHSQPIPQLDKIASIYDAYYQKILEVYSGIRNRYYHEKKELVVSPTLTNLIQRATVITSSSKQSKNRTKLTLKQEELPPYLVTITTRQRMTLAEAGKLTCESSAKGVVVEMADEECMPLTAEGIRSDVAMSKDASAGRMIMGRDLQLVMGQAVQQTGRMVANALGVTKDLSKRRLFKTLEQLMRDNDQKIQEAYALMEGYMRIINVDVADSFLLAIQEQDQVNLMALLVLAVRHGVVVPLPVDYLAKNPAWVILQNIDNSIYKTHKSRVTYKDPRGIIVSPKEPIRVGPINFTILEKTGAEISISSSAKSQALGFYAVNSKQDKDCSPVPHTNVKIMSTDEGPVLSGALGAGFMAELVDRVSSPDTHMTEVKNMLMSDHPTAQDTLVPRDDMAFGGVANRITAMRAAGTATPTHLTRKRRHGPPAVPYGNTTARRLFGSILACYGTQLKYVPEKED